MMIDETCRAKQILQRQEYSSFSQNEVILQVYKMLYSNGDEEAVSVLPNQSNQHIVKELKPQLIRPQFPPQQIRYLAFGKNQNVHFQYSKDLKQIRYPQRLANIHMIRRTIFPDYYSKKIYFNQSLIIRPLLLKNIAEDINFKNLLYLHLNNNQIDNIEPISWLQCKSVKIIDLCDNNIVNLKSIAKTNFPQFQWLNVYHNQFHFSQWHWTSRVHYKERFCNRFQHMLDIRSNNYHSCQQLLKKGIKYEDIHELFKQKMPSKPRDKTQEWDSDPKYCNQIEWIQKIRRNGRLDIPYQAFADVYHQLNNGKKCVPLQNDQDDESDESQEQDYEDYDKRIVKKRKESIKNIKRCGKIKIMILPVHFLKKGKQQIRVRNILLLSKNQY